MSFNDELLSLFGKLMEANPLDQFTDLLDLLVDNRNRRMMCYHPDNDPRMFPRNKPVKCLNDAMLKAEIEHVLKFGWFLP